MKVILVLVCLSVASHASVIVANEVLASVNMIAVSAQFRAAGMLRVANITGNCELIIEDDSPAAIIAYIEWSFLQNCPPLDEAATAHHITGVVYGLPTDSDRWLRPRFNPFTKAFPATMMRSTEATQLLALSATQENLIIEISSDPNPWDVYTATVAWRAFPYVAVIGQTGYAVYSLCCILLLFARGKYTLNVKLKVLFLALYTHVVHAIAFGTDPGQVYYVLKGAHSALLWSSFLSGYIAYGSILLAWQEAVRMDHRQPKVARAAIIFTYASYVMFSLATLTYFAEIFYPPISRYTIYFFLSVVPVTLLGHCFLFIYSGFRLLKALRSLDLSNLEFTPAKTVILRKTTVTMLCLSFSYFSLVIVAGVYLLISLDKMEILLLSLYLLEFTILGCAGVIQYAIASQPRGTSSNNMSSSGGSEGNAIRNSMSIPSSLGKDNGSIGSRKSSIGSISTSKSFNDLASESADPLTTFTRHVKDIEKGKLDVVYEDVESRS